MECAGRVLLSVALVVLSQMTMSGVASALPAFDASAGASVFDAATRTFVRDSISAPGEAMILPTVVPGGSADAIVQAAAVPLVEADAFGTGTTTAGAQGGLLYYIEVAGPSAPIGSFPLDMLFLMSATIHGDNASSSASIQVVSTVSDGFNLHIGVSCFTNTPFPDICVNGGQLDETLTLGLTPGDIYQVFITAGAGAGGSPLSDSATGFADPHFFIDPSFDNVAGYQLLISDGVGNDVLGGGGPPSSVPEPSSLLVLGGALAALGYTRRRAR
jgi:hypothetical protein